MNISDLFTKVDKISVDEVKHMITEKGKDGVTLLDVREPAEYTSGHIPGSRFMPLSSLSGDMKKLDPSGTIITYCRRGPRSKSAAALLRRRGFENIYYMDGGIDAWNGLVASGQYDAGLFLLEGRKSIDDLIVLAWSLENGTGMFYSQIKELVAEADAKKVFESLAEAEQRHKLKVIESYRVITGREITDEALREKSIQGYMEGGVSVQGVVDWIKKENADLRDILEISMQIETNSLDLYMKMRMEVEDDVAKKTFDNLINEEEVHLSRLGKLLESKIKN